MKTKQIISIFGLKKCANKNIQEEKNMKVSIKSVGIYLIVFLVGWSCAVLSYSDAIYSQHDGSIEGDVVKTNKTKSKI